MSGGASQKCKVTFWIWHFSRHTAAVFESDVGKKGESGALLAFAKQSMEARSRGDTAFRDGGGGFKQTPVDQAAEITVGGRAVSCLHGGGNPHAAVGPTLTHRQCVHTRQGG